MTAPITRRGRPPARRHDRWPGSRAAALRVLTVPTLVIHGLDDTLIDPSGGRRTAELVPGARLLLVPDMGHDRPREARADRDRADVGARADRVGRARRPAHGDGRRSDDRVRAHRYATDPGTVSVIGADVGRGGQRARRDRERGHDSAGVGLERGDRGAHVDGRDQPGVRACGHRPGEGGQRDRAAPSRPSRRRPPGPGRHTKRRTRAHPGTVGQRQRRPVQRVRDGRGLARVGHLL